MIVNSVIHDFQEKLVQSLDLSDEANWVPFYQRLWPELISCVRLDKDSVWQRSGVDRVLFLPNGRQLFVDEKKRLPDRNGRTYDDFLCEEWSVFRSDGRENKVGWTLDANKRCDLIAYAIPALGKCYLLPFEILRLTAKRFLLDWKDVQFAYPKDAQNNGYVTRNCAVSWDRLFRDMRVIVQFNEKLNLPTPSFSNGQVLFNFT